MRKLFAALMVSFVFVSNSFSQTFEGTIEYSNAFYSRTTQLTNDQLEYMVGSKLTYHVKDGYYKNISNGATVVMQIYDWNSNRLYNKMQSSDTLYWFDASENKDTIINFDIKEEVGKVMGITCDALTITTQSGSMTFYYNKAYRMKVGKFANHTFNNWAFFLEKTKSIPLKIVMETQAFTMTSTATVITPTKLTDDFFAIDPHAIIKKSE